MPDNPELTPIIIETMKERENVLLVKVMAWVMAMLLLAINCGRGLFDINPHLFPAQAMKRRRQSSVESEDLQAATTKKQKRRKESHVFDPWDVPPELYSRVSFVFMFYLQTPPPPD